MTPDRRSGLLLAALSAILFSGKAIVVKLMYRHNVDPETVIALRMGMSAPVFGAIAWWQAQGSERLCGRDLRTVAVLGFLGYYLSSLLDFWGLMYVSAALERLILFLTPTLVLLISAVVLHRKINARQWLAMAVSYVGISLVFIENLRWGGDQVLLGAGLVFAAALSYALYLIVSGEIVQRIGSTRLVAYVMCVACALSLGHYALVHPPTELFAQTTPVLGLSAINAVFCTILPVFLTMYAISRVGAPSTSQMSVLGPISLLFLSAWLLQEPVTSVQLLGAAIVIGGVLLISTPAR